MNDMDSLLYNQVSMKAAHNSYQRDEPLIEQICWNSGEPFNNGCRAVELDIAEAPSRNAWSVGHQDSYDRYYRQLSGFLSDLLVWSNENPNHDVITLYLDIKHAESGFPDRLDYYIKSRLAPCGDDKFFSPGYFLSENPGKTLWQAVTESGWPSLKELRGKFLICLSGDSQSTAFYSSTNPAIRLCFADLEMKRDTDLPIANNVIFFNYNLGTDEISRWSPVLRLAASQMPNSIIRAYELNGQKL